MPPKGSGKIEQKQDELTAFVIADSFNERFQPITSSIPRCLMPLANVPLIEYTLEFLAMSGVEKIYLVCHAHAQAIRDYIARSRWADSVVPAVDIIVSKSMFCFGDAMRELDVPGNIVPQTREFIVLHGDVVANFDLSNIIEQHKRRRQADPNTIMTMVLKKASISHRTRTHGEESLFILDGKTNECIHWESATPYPAKAFAAFDTERLEKRSEVAIYNDLIDVQIDICQPDVPALYTENFDWRESRRDFVRGVLESELIGKTIYGYFLDEGYAARVASPQMYDSVAKDIIGRWAYPLVIENNLMAGDAYKHGRSHVYKANGVKLAITTELKQNVVIGPGTIIGDKTVVSNSVVGKNCRIGSGVTIRNAYIWDNSVVEAGCTLDRCIVADHARIQEQAVVGRGCLIAQNVVVPAKLMLEKNTRMGMDADGNLSYLRDEQLAGSDNESDAENDEDPRNAKLTNIGETWHYNSEEDEIFEDSDPEEESDSDGEGGAAENDFIREAEATLHRAFSEDHTVDIAFLELSTLKMSMDVSFQDIRKVLVPAIFNHMDASKMPKSAADVIKRWGPLINKCTHGGQDQLDLLRLIEEFFSSREDMIKHMSRILHLLYDQDVLSEEAIIRWHRGVSDIPAVRSKIKEACAPLVTWLEEAEEDSEDDE
ncbi:hypothetical protein HDU85_002913 [Gaertneriomyces sp. JEL0708]|nr:hypothetical protein HDU85_002913 [Gaertneriomyces sp. JEL0708]